ncbi:synaptogenesis protein syg-1-like isoform X2 [Saccoglossus kowalevskii]|nr:PREDICTED: uncharacterized protein LOC100378217 isoform X1 [Saccoglossus kowalevskii]
MKLLAFLIFLCAVSGISLASMDFFLDPSAGNREPETSNHHYFMEEPHDTTVAVGNTAIFECSIGNKKGLVAWVKTTGPKDRTILSLDNSIIADNNQILIGSRVGGRDYALIITHITHEDEGFYTCFVSAGGRDSPIISHSALLTVV